MRKYLPTLLAAHLAATLTASARADLLRLVADPSTIEMKPGEIKTFTIGIDNLQPTGDLMALWQLRLVVAPAGLTTGTVLFADARIPSGDPNYVFYGVGTPTNPPSGLPGNVMLAGAGPALLGAFVGAGPVLQGVTVGDGDVVLVVDAVASSEALGTWDLEATYGASDNSFWSNSNLTRRDWDPVSVIGTIAVAPEPTAALLGLTAGICGLVGYGWRRQSRS